MSTPNQSTKSKSFKAAPKSLSITLRLSPSLLARFPSERPVPLPVEEKIAPAPVPPPAPTPVAPTLQVKDDELSLPPAQPALESESLSVSTPIPNDGASTPTASGNKRKSGVKRSAAAMDADGLPKSRGKPGPKKRMRMDADVNSPFGGPTPLSGHKLGPKANQGAINAGLRALDRSGKPCKKWERKTLALKSFTGAAWTMPSWRTFKTLADATFEGDVKSDASSSDAKPDSGRESERSQRGGDPSLVGVMPMEIASSPASQPIHSSAQV